jgi:hypothetical protein
VGGANGTTVGGDTPNSDDPVVAIDRARGKLWAPDGAAGSSCKLQFGGRLRITETTESWQARMIIYGTMSEKEAQE